MSSWWCPLDLLRYEGVKICSFHRSAAVFHSTTPSHLDSDPIHPFMDMVSFARTTIFLLPLVRLSHSLSHLQRRAFCLLSFISASVRAREDRLDAAGAAAVAADIGNGGGSALPSTAMDLQPPRDCSCTLSCGECAGDLLTMAIPSLLRRTTQPRRSMAPSLGGAGSRSS